VESADEKNQVTSGWGVALVHAGKVLAGLARKNADEAAGSTIIRKASQVPLRQIAGPVTV
jgi:chaperonin GroEL